MKKRSVFFVVLFVMLSFIMASFTQFTVNAEAASTPLQVQGELESVQVNASPLGSTLRMLTEQKWTQRVNEVLARLAKRGVKINDRVLAAVIEALGIDPVGPFSGESWSERLTGGQVSSLGQDTIKKHSSPSAYIEEVVNELISVLGENTRFNEDPELSDSTTSS